jgi:GT2 family glycosyltransferase
MEYPKVFAIIVTHNGERWVDRCLGSLSQSSVPITPVVIDNASSDNTVPIIQENYPRAILFQQCTNLGFGRANNIGLEFALQQQCNYVFLLNQDASIEKDTIAKLISCHRLHPEYGIISPIHLYEKDRLDFYFEIYLEKNTKNLLSDLLLKKPQQIYEISFVNAAAWLISGECLNKAGGFDPLFVHYGEDQDYVARARYHGFKTGVCMDAYAYHFRPQKPRTTEQTRELYMFLIRNYYKALKTPEHPLVRNFIHVLKLSLKAQFANLFRLRFSPSLMNLCALVHVACNLRHVARHRKISLTKERAFLFNNH